MKRILDISVVLVGLLLISPLLLAIAALIKLQDGEPVIFRQQRVGRNGETFTMLKFRSMVVDPETRTAELMRQDERRGVPFMLRYDPRITGLGRFLRRFSLDELPQLLNILSGDMSLVGPRPYLAIEQALMPSDASRRLLVTPGATGLWQVSRTSDVEYADAVRLDLRYVDNWSLKLDLIILWKALVAVLTQRGG